MPESIRSMIPTQKGNELNLAENTWVATYYTDFKKRLLNLFGFEFRNLACSLAFQFVGEKNINQG